MQTKRFILISLVATVAVLTVTGGAYAFHRSQQQIDTFAKLEQACHQNKDADGYGNVTMSGGSFVNQTGAISVSCKIHLRPGSTLQFRHTKLRTKNFVIYDAPKESKDANTAEHKKQLKPNHVLVSHANFVGNDALFQINLGNAGSSAVVEDSSINYPQSVVVGVGQGDTDDKAVLAIARNTMQSTDTNGQGIILVSTGKATFLDNSFMVSDPPGNALLLGESCEFRNNTNANDRCHGDQ
jgi:hypothetical protein